MSKKKKKRQHIKIVRQQKACARTTTSASAQHDYWIKINFKLKQVVSTLKRHVRAHRHRIHQYTGSFRCTYLYWFFLFLSIQHKFCAPLKLKCHAYRLSIWSHIHYGASSQTTPKKKQQKSIGEAKPLMVVDVEIDMIDIENLEWWEKWKTVWSMDWLMQIFDLNVNGALWYVRSKV